MFMCFISAVHSLACANVNIHTIAIRLCMHQNACSMVLCVYLYVYLPMQNY